jgi:hypothetical protein
MKLTYPSTAAGRLIKPTSGLTPVCHSESGARSHRTGSLVKTVRG